MMTLLDSGSNARTLQRYYGISYLDRPQSRYANRRMTSLRSLPLTLASERLKCFTARAFGGKTYDGTGSI